MADDTPQSVADSPTTDPNIIPPPESASIDPNRPVSTILADSPPEPATPSADLSGEALAKSDLATDYTPPVSPPADSPVATESAIISSSPSPEPAEAGSIPASSPPNEPSQVQPVVPESAPSSQVPDEASQSAEIKPEPLEGTQNAPLADSEAPVSPKTSFGDLVSDQPKPVQSPLPAEALAKEGVSPQPDIDTVVEAKADFSLKRQQALQTRRKKRDDHLAKIITLIGQKGKVFNRDVRYTLRVSQSTASEYLQTLVKDGKIKREGKAKATIYLL